MILGGFQNTILLFQDLNVQNSNLMVVMLHHKFYVKCVLIQRRHKVHMLQLGTYPEHDDIVNVAALDLDMWPKKSTYLSSENTVCSPSLQVQVAI